MKTKMKDPVTGAELCAGCNGMGWLATPPGVVLRPGADWTCDECHGSGLAKAEGK